MKIALLLILTPFFGLSQNMDSLIIHDFWKKYDKSIRDTLTIFNDFSVSIKELPDEFYQLKHLRIVKLDFEISLEELSSDVKNFTELEELLIQKSKLTSLPKEIGQLKKLKSLTVAWGGQLSHIPPEIGDLENLEHLDLYRNNLTTLPESIKNLKSLKLLRLGENNFSEDEKQRIKRLLPNCEVRFDYN